MKSSSHQAYGLSRVIRSESLVVREEKFGPNRSYLGEVILQTGPPVLALSVIPTPASYLLPLSPLFTYVLLRYASGVPPLERSAEQKWGKEDQWREYTRATPLLFPWPFGAGKGKLDQ